MSLESQQEKRGRIRTLLEAHDLDALILRKGANVAWIIDGRAHVPTTLELACLDVIIYRDRIVVVTNKIEAPRLTVEELSGAEELVVVNWFEARDAQLPIGPRIGIDGPDNERRNLAGEIETLRRSLNEFEVERLRAIGRDATEALEEAMLDVESDASELELAGEIAEELWERDLEPVVLLVAGAERIAKYRHPLPTGSELGEIAMGVICARRKGLIASVTRLVSFAPITTARAADYENLLHVEAAFLNETRSGATFATPFKSGQLEYVKRGFDRDEWTLHHQGGSTGYLPRDFTAHEKSDQVIATNNAIAWNPSARGLKVEDTLIANAAGFEFVTGSSQWPTIEIAGRIRPQIAQR